MSSLSKKSVTSHPESSLEEELLLAVVRPGTSLAKMPELQERLSSLPLDWGRIMQLASNHRIRPQLYNAFNGTMRSIVPAEIFERLRTYYLFNVNRNMMLTQETLRISRLLAEQGAESLVFKGPLQASMIYKNLALREMADIDTIIHPQDLSRAKAALLANGYFVDPNHDKMDVETILKDRNKYSLALWREDRKVYLEIHWKVMPAHSWYSYKDTDVWQFARPQAMGDSNVNVLEREFIFIFLCIHNEKHNWYGLRYLADVATMLQTNSDLDWDRLLQQAKTFGKLNSLLITCNLCEKLLGVELPPAIRQKIPDNALMHAKCATIRAKMFYEDEFVFPSYREWRFHRRLFAKGRSFAADLFNPLFYMISILWPEYRDKRHFLLVPPELNFLYVFSRLMRYIKWNWLPASWSMRAEKNNP